MQLVHLGIRELGNLPLSIFHPSIPESLNFPNRSEYAPTPA
jgi:hypothetical protein